METVALAAETDQPAQGFGGAAGERDLDIQLGLIGQQGGNLSRQQMNDYTMKTALIFIEKIQRLLPVAALGVTVGRAQAILQPPAIARFGGIRDGFCQAAHPGLVTFAATCVAYGKSQQ